MCKKLIFTFNAGLLTMLICSGCGSGKKVPPLEFVNVPIYVAAQTIPSGDQGKVRSDPVVRSYAIGRYVDPNRRNVMHEQHTVYREEQSPCWNLIPQPDADPLLMAQRTKEERYANAMTGQIAITARDMQETRELVQKILESCSGQNAKNKELVKQIDELKKRYGIVSGNLMRSSEYINTLGTELNKLQKETEIMKLQLRRKEK